MSYDYGLNLQYVNPYYHQALLTENIDSIPKYQRRFFRKFLTDLECQNPNIRYLAASGTPVIGKNDFRGPLARILISEHLLKNPNDSAVRDGFEKACDILRLPKSPKVSQISKVVPKIELPPVADFAVKLLGAGLNLGLKAALTLLRR